MSVSRPPFFRNVTPWILVFLRNGERVAERELQNRVETPHARLRIIKCQQVRRLPRDRDAEGFQLEESRQPWGVSLHEVIQVIITRCESGVGRQNGRPCRAAGYDASDLVSDAMFLPPWEDN